MEARREVALRRGKNSAPVVTVLACVSGPGVGLLIRTREAFGAHMGINLGGAKRGMAEEFLNTAKICPAIE